MKTLCFVNQKGGVGKTTSCLNIGAALQRQGRRVLIIDMDAQGSLTKSTGLNTLPENTVKNSGISERRSREFSGAYDGVDITMQTVYTSSTSSMTANTSTQASDSLMLLSFVHFMLRSSFSSAADCCGNMFVDKHTIMHKKLFVKNILLFFDKLFP